MGGVCGQGASETIKEEKKEELSLEMMPDSSVDWTNEIEMQHLLDMMTGDVLSTDYSTPNDLGVDLSLVGVSDMGLGMTWGADSVF